MSEDLIKRSDAIKVVRHISMEFVDADTRQKLIEALPSADRPQGEWEMQEDIDGLYGICSVCGQDADFSHYYKAYNFCPHCGARMKGADDE